MKKKLLSLVMAVAMVLSLAVPAFAANYWEYSTDTSKQDKAEQKVVFDAKTFTPTIKLTLPDTSTAIPMVLNPYRIEYTGNIGTESAKINGQVVSAANWNDQIICPIYAIQNETNAKLNVKAKTETTVAGEVTLATTNHVSLSDTAKTAMINLVVKKTSVDSSWMSNSSYAIDTASAMGKLDAYDSANNTVIKLAATTNDVQVATLKNASIEPDGTKMNYLLFQFDGELTRNSTKAWTASDKIKTTITFTFTPVSIGDAVASVDKSSDQVSFATPTTAVTVALPTSTSDKGDLTDIAQNPSASAWAFSLNTTPNWSVVDGSVFGVGTNDKPSISGTTLSIPAAALDKLPKDNVKHDYTVVLGFDDKNGVPRTVELTIQLTRASST